MTVEVYVMDYGRKYLQLQWTDPHTGKRVTQSSKCTSKQMKQAILKAEEKKKQLNAVDSPQDGSIGWKDFRDRFACQMLSGAATRTSQTYISILNMLEKFRRPTELRQVNSRFLSEYAGWLRGLPRSETTIQTHMRHIKAVMRWARANRFIPEIPSIPVVTRASKRKLMKGRPLTDAEFQLFLSKIPEVVGPDHAANWTWMARGLWLSGLRLDESTMLSWDSTDGFHVIVDGDRAKLRIPDWVEKGHEDRIYPLTPDFVQFLLAVPEDQRRGLVFRPTYTNHRNSRVETYRNSREVGRTFSAVGKLAGIVVDIKRLPGKPPVEKHASAHDLRRSFGTRWSRIIEQPAVLMELMRHSAIETTMMYYVGNDADQLQDSIYRSWERLHNTPHNTSDEKKPKPR